MTYFVLLLMVLWKSALWISMQVGFLWEDIKWWLFDSRRK